MYRYALSAFRAQHNDRLVLICPGRIESYVKYAEVAYDLFHCGFDVMIIDHRGQGRSGRLLSDTHRGHVVNFSDYVDDLARSGSSRWFLDTGENGLSLLILWAERLPRFFCNVTGRIAMQ